MGGEGGGGAGGEEEEEQEDGGRRRRRRRRSPSVSLSAPLEELVVELLLSLEQLPQLLGLTFAQLLALCVVGRETLFNNNNNLIHAQNHWQTPERKCSSVH